MRSRAKVVLVIVLALAPAIVALFIGDRGLLPYAIGLPAFALVLLAIKVVLVPVPPQIITLRADGIVVSGDAYGWDCVSVIDEGSRLEINLGAMTTGRLARRADRRRLVLEERAIGADMFARVKHLVRAQAR